MPLLQVCLDYGELVLGCEVSDVHCSLFEWYNAFSHITHCCIQNIKCVKQRYMQCWNIVFSFPSLFCSIHFFLFFILQVLYPLTNKQDMSEAWPCSMPSCLYLPLLGHNPTILRSMQQTLWFSEMQKCILTACPHTKRNKNQKTQL